jgi:hypothetical protein
MEIVQRAGFKTAQGEVRRHDVTIVLGYAAFAISCGNIFGALSSGMAPSDFATMMVVFRSTLSANLA